MKDKQKKRYVLKTRMARKTQKTLWTRKRIRNR
jgi:hypothetical protein